MPFEVLRLVMRRRALTPFMLRSRPLAAFALGVGLWGSSVSAHGLDANHVQIVVHEGVVEVVATPPSEFVSQADANGDGLLNVDEVRARREEILRALMAATVVTDGEGRAGALDRSDVSVPRGDDDGARGSDFLRLTVVLRWPTHPAAIRVRFGFLMQHPVSVYATRAESLSTPGMLTLVGDGEYVTLPTRQSEAVMLRQPATAAPQSPVASPQSPTVRSVANVPIRHSSRVPFLAALALAAASLGAVAARRVRRAG